MTLKESRLPFRQLIHERDISRTIIIGLGKRGNGIVVMTSLSIMRLGGRLDK